MTKPKWTKGPWYADDLYVGGNKNQAIYTGATKENGKRVKDIESFWNARLISAAPDMHEAISELMQDWGDAIADSDPELYKKFSWCLMKVGA